MKRPSDIKYWLTDCPPFFQLLFLAMQQMVTICVPLVLIPIILREGNVDEFTIISTLSWAMIAMAFGSVLQVLWKGKIGSGFLAPPLVSAIYLNVSIYAMKEGGLPCLMTMTVFAGFMEIFFGKFLIQLRYIFTPPVIGLIVFMVGFIIAIEGWEKIIDLGHIDSEKYSLHILASVICLFAIFAFSVWGKGILKLISVFAGILLGCIMAAGLGLYHQTDLSAYHQMPWIYFPKLPSYSFHFSYKLVLPFIMCAIAAALRVMGTLITCQHINDADWRSPDYKNIRKGVFADGLGAIIAAMLGSPGITASPSSVGVAKLTGATSRYIVFMLSALFIIFAFLPKISALFLIIPISIAGVALLVNGSFMILAGIEIMTIRAIDIRVIFIIGIALTAGTSRIFLTQYFDKLTGIWSLLTASVLTMTALSAILITLLSRIDIRKKHIVDKHNPLAKPIDFNLYLKKQFEKWTLDPLLMERASECGKSILISLMKTGLDCDAIKVSLSYDKVNLCLQYEYEGAIPNMPFTQNAAKKHMVEEQAFYIGLTKMLSGVFPDDHSFKSKGKECTLNFYFYC